jgi:predicted PurR-regulated permease PerM
MTEPGKESGNRGSGFTIVQRVTLLVLLLLLVYVARKLLLLLFAGVLLGVLFRTVSVWLASKTPLSLGWSLFAVVLVLVGGIASVGWLFAPQLADQVRQLADTLPQAASRLLEQVRSTTFGGWALEQMGSAGGNSQEKVVERATSAAWKVVDAVVAFAIIVFTGLYLAASPDPYIRGFLRLLPLARRRRAAEVLFASGYTLRWWLLGQLLSMTIVGVLMGVGLALIGVPLAFALGVLAGLFEFVPTIGPVIGLLPALLLALAEDPRSALYVLVLYTIVQTIESYLLTPLVQERVIELPPVITIATQVLFAWTLGALGVLVAVPFVAVAVLVVQLLYVKDSLGDRMRISAEEHGRRELEETEVLGSLT